jgi:P4 family phage/plasmid primase-like protien
MNSEEIASNICEELVSVSSMQVFSAAITGKHRDYRSGTIGTLIYEAVKKSTLKYMSGKAYAFNGQIYIPIEDYIFNHALKTYLVRMHVDMGDVSRSMRNFIYEAFQALKICCRLEPTYHIIAFQNGVVNMDTRELMPFSPDHHVIYLNEYKFDPKADCPLWKTFLREVLPEVESRLTLQMYLSLGLFNRGKMSDKVENCLMLFGTGSNGKSVVNETVKGVFGSPNVSEMGLMALIKGGDERCRNISMIEGKIFNYCAEVQARDISDYSDSFKSLCSGENQQGRLIGKNPYIVKNVPWLIFNMNNPPRCTDSSYGFFRRFLYVVFDHVIPDEHQNKHLAKDLAAEYPGILNWIMRGRDYLKRRQYQFPISENAEKRKLLNIGETNPTLMWMKIRGVRNAPSVKGELYTWIKGSSMCKDMAAVCEQNGFTPDTSRRFALELQKYGWGGRTSKKRGSGGTLYKVYGLNEEAFKEVPNIIDMDISADDPLNQESDYDPGDTY